MHKTDGVREGEETGKVWDNYLEDLRGAKANTLYDYIPPTDEELKAYNNKIIGQRGAGIDWFRAIFGF